MSADVDAAEEEPSICPCCKETYHPTRGWTLVLYFDEFCEITVCQDCYDRLEHKADPEDRRWNA